MNNNNLWHDMDNTEDKKLWTQKALSDEYDFVNRIAPILNIDVIINPEKSTNKYAPDLLRNGIQLADLKHEKTPFFTASRYGVAPQKAVTFNEKDYLRYKSLYPNIHIYMWVEWGRTVYPLNPSLEVEYMEGVWEIPFPSLQQMIEQGQFSLHEYKRRLNDSSGNGKRSFVLDLDNLYLIKQRKKK